MAEEAYRLIQHQLNHLGIHISDFETAKADLERMRKYTEGSRARDAATKAEGVRKDAELRAFMEELRKKGRASIEV